MVERNHNTCIEFTPDMDPIKLHLLQHFLFGYFIEVVLLNNINARIDG